MLDIFSGIPVASVVARLYGTRHHLQSAVQEGPQGSLRNGARSNMACASTEALVQ